MKHIASRSSVALFFCFGLFCALFFVAPARAQILLSAELNLESKAAFLTSATATVEASTGGSLIADFSTLGETMLTFTLSAPTGQYVEIVTDPGWDSIVLDIDMVYGGIGQGVGAFRDETPVITINSVAGGAAFLPPSVDLVFLSGPGRNLVFARFDFSLTPGSIYRFDEIRIETTVTAGYNVNLASGFVRGEIVGTMEDAELGGADPGQFVHLVPEPSRAALLALGGLAALYRRRR